MVSVRADGIRQGGFDRDHHGFWPVISVAKAGALFVTLSLTPIPLNRPLIADRSIDTISPVLSAIDAPILALSFWLVGKASTPAEQRFPSIDFL